MSPFCGSPQLRLPWFQGAKVVAADQDLAVPDAATAEKRRSAKAGVAHGLKVVLSGLVDKAGKRFERSIPAVRFGHVAYIR